MDTITKDNQQVTQHQLAWLSGIWDGEGTFQIYRNGNNNYYSGRLTLTNTSEIMISEIMRIFDNFEIRGHIWKEEPRKETRKACYHLTINKIMSVKIGTELMLPYLIVKKAQAELLIRFLESRLKYKREPILDSVTGKIIGTVKNGYSEEEISFYEQMKQLNKRGPS